MHNEAIKMPSQKHNDVQSSYQFELKKKNNTESSLNFEIGISLQAALETASLSHSISLIYSSFVFTIDLKYKKNSTPNPN
jgi:hypothetical protein